MLDGFGVILALIRADAGVAAIAGTRIGAEAAAPPCVVLVDLASTARPYGPGSRLLGLQRFLGAARCYGEDSPTGAITARQLAGAVLDALDGHGIHVGTSSRLMLRSWAPTIDGLVRDPDTHWPQYDVAIDAVLAAEAA